MDGSTRYRLSRVIQKAVIDYLWSESSWQPNFDIEHLDEKVAINVLYPPESKLPSFEITIIEKLDNG